MVLVVSMTPVMYVDPNRECPLLVVIGVIALVEGTQSEIEDQLWSLAHYNAKHYKTSTSSAEEVEKIWDACNTVFIPKDKVTKYTIKIVMAEKNYIDFKSYALATQDAFYKHQVATYGYGLSAEIYTVSLLSGVDPDLMVEYYEASYSYWFWVYMRETR